MFAPDSILLGIGGNDIGYGDVATKMFLGNPYAEFQDMSKRMDTLSNRMEQLHERFASLKIDPKSIFYAEYFDVLRNDYGILDATCEKTGLATTWDFFLADKTIRGPINDLIATTCAKCGWTKIDGVDEMFSRHGICARNTFVRSLRESMGLQGDINGAFHPNAKGHQGVTEFVWNKMEPLLKKKLGNGHKRFKFHGWEGFYTA